jgi:hypothetical protein
VIPVFFKHVNSFILTTLIKSNKVTPLTKNYNEISWRHLLQIEWRTMLPLINLHKLNYTNNKRFMEAS